MSTRISVRLDDDTGLALKRLARKTGRTRSEIIRQAVVRLSEAVVAQERARSPYEALADFIGCAQCGPTGLSTRTGEKFRKVLAERAARRR